jgi:hypothetical protein
MSLCRQNVPILAAAVLWSMNQTGAVRIIRVGCTSRRPDISQAEPEKRWLIDADESAAKTYILVRTTRTRLRSHQLTASTTKSLKTTPDGRIGNVVCDWRPTLFRPLNLPTADSQWYVTYAF